MMDGGERKGVAWRERGKQGGAHGSNMQPLCHGNAVKYLWLHRICVWCWKGRVVLVDLKVMRASKLCSGWASDVHLAQDIWFCLQ